MPNENYAKQGYLLEDFRLFHLKGTSGVRTEYHYHEFCKLLILLSGRGSYWIEGQQYALQPGDTVLVGSHCVHRPDFELDSPYERIIIYISPDFLRRSSTADCDLTDCFCGKWGHVLRSETDSRRLISIAEALERELSGSGYGRLILSSGLLLRLLVETCRGLQQAEALEPGPAQPKDPRVMGLMRYIDEHATEELNIDTLAEQFYLSKYHMMRLFRAGTGTSINAYITRQRLILAREMISQGMPATESCFRAGFGSYSSFTRTYGKLYGTTPTGRQYTALAQDESYE